MKLLLTFLPILLLSVPVFADESFDAQTKGLCFNSDVLVDVITDTFDDDVKLEVAKKYVNVMDGNGCVSIADLVEVCHFGQLDNMKCRGFIDNLISGMGENLYKPFYWLDYAKIDAIRTSNVYVSGDGYSKHGDLKEQVVDSGGSVSSVNKVLDNGQWALQFGYMTNPTSKFRKQYPNTTYLIGTSACTNESGTQYVADASKNFSPNEQSGNHCWLKITEPENSSWIYVADKSSGDGGSCARSCALSSMTKMRDEKQARIGAFSDLVHVEVGGLGVHEITNSDVFSKGLIKGIESNLESQRVIYRSLDFTGGMPKGNFACAKVGAQKQGERAKELPGDGFVGNHCWCKYTYPTGIKDWVYATEIAQGSCASHYIDNPRNSCEQCCMSSCTLDFYNRVMK